jgi:hypothetical protein
LACSLEPANAFYMSTASNLEFFFVSRKGAKEQREKENSLDVILAPLRLCGKCLVAAVLLCASVVDF